MTALEWNCSEWRQLTVSDTLNRLGHHKAKLIHVSGFLNFLDPAIQDLVGPCDLIIFQRNLVSQQAYDSMSYWQGMGKPVAVDLDDAYPILPWSNPAHAFWIENSSKLEKNPIVILEEGLRRSDGLIAPNRLLLQDWKHVTPGYYLQNYARSEWWTNLPTRTELKEKRGIPGRIVIGWGGSISHYDSWWGSGIREAATHVSRRHPEVLWMVCGNDKRIYDQLEVPWGSKTWQQGVQPGDWPKIVSTFDIGVAPLYGPYDQRRSWIKGLEYLLGSVPWIGTTGEPYKDMQGLGNLIENGANNWEEALENTIARIKPLQEEAASRVPIARQWFAENQEKTYERVYFEIINNFKAEKGRLADLIYVNWSGESVQKEKEDSKGVQGG